MSTNSEPSQRISKHQLHFLIYIFLFNAVSSFKSQMKWNDWFIIDFGISRNAGSIPNGEPCFRFHNFLNFLNFRPVFFCVLVFYFWISFQERRKEKILNLLGLSPLVKFVRFSEGGSSAVYWLCLVNRMHFYCIKYQKQLENGRIWLFSMNDLVVYCINWKAKRKKWHRTKISSVAYVVNRISFELK